MHNRRRRLFIATGLSWSLLVSAFFILAEPYGYMSSSDWFNFWLWIFVPPLIFFFIFYIFSWATKGGANDLGDSAENKSLPNETPSPKTHPVEKTTKEFDEVRFINVAEIVREKFLARVTKDQALFVDSDSAPSGISTSMISKYMNQRIAIQYSIGISMVAGIWKDMDFFNEDTRVQKLINRLNKKLEDDFKAISPKGIGPLLLSENEVTEIKLVAIEVATRITNRQAQPFLPFYSAIWVGSSYLEYNSYEKDKSKIIENMKDWDKRFTPMIKGDLKLLGEATGL